MFRVECFSFIVYQQFLISPNLNCCHMSWLDIQLLRMFFDLFMYPVTLLSNTAYLHSAVSLIEDVQLLSRSGFWLTQGVCVCVSLCCWCLCRVAWQDVKVHTVRTGGGKPVSLAYLLWFQSPHIPTYTLTHPASAAVLRMGVLLSKTLIVIFSSTSHCFTWNCALLEVGGYTSLSLSLSHKHNVLHEAVLY